MRVLLAPRVILVRDAKAHPHPQRALARMSSIGSASVRHYMRLQRCRHMRRYVSVRRTVLFAQSDRLRMRTRRWRLLRIRQSTRLWGAVSRRTELSGSRDDRLRVLRNGWGLIHRALGCAERYLQMAVGHADVSGGTWVPPVIIQTLTSAAQPRSRVTISLCYVRSSGCGVRDLGFGLA